MKIFSIGTLFAIIAAFFWGTLSVFAKQLKLEGFTAADLSQLRIYGVAIVLMIFAFFRRDFINIFSKKDIFFILSAGFLGQALNTYFYFLSVQTIPAGIAVLLEYLAPVFIGIIALFLGWEKLSKKMFLSFAFILTGLFLSIGYNIGFIEIHTKGIVFGLLSAISLAGYALLSKPLLLIYSPLKILSFGIWAASIFWLCIKNPILILTKVAHSNLLLIIPSVFFIIFLSTLLPFWLYLSAIKYIGPTRATMIACLEPFFSSVMCAIFCDEILTFQQYIGGIIVLLGIILLESRNLTRNKEDIKLILKKENKI
ncbi:DMT family transporter [Fluviispira vulneris]|uniref:DMT family transporter n=1 Tax=Fluviispira vulneris TaxID=2763012 RepID=UPI001646A11A|nr:DMT family transporter [Fluviispira vulneris]